MTTTTKGAMMPCGVRPATKVVVFQWPCGDADTQAFAAAAAAVAASHLGRSHGLVDEDQAFGIEIAGLRTRPRAASECQVGLARPHARSFFARDGVAGEEAPDRAIAEGHAFVGERLAQLFDRHVGRRFKES